MDRRTVFDRVPEQFDRWRSRYCDELFADLIAYARLDASRNALEVGPGTGQATEPVLKTGCAYTAIELSAIFTEMMKKKYAAYPNFHILNADFETYPFGNGRFDLVYSAAAFQWIPEKIGYPKAYDILKSGGTFAMFIVRPDTLPGGGYTEEPLFSEIQRVYAEFFHPEMEYTCKLDYGARGRYGFVNLKQLDYCQAVEYSAEEYVAFIGTHSDHITLNEPYRSKFFTGIKEAINRCGGRITLHNRMTMYLARKP